MKRLRTHLILSDFTSDVLFALIQFLSFWDIFYLIKTCSKINIFGKEERTVNFLVEKLFRELAPKKGGLFEWVIDLVNLRHKEYLRTLLGREIIFSEIAPRYNPVITVGPFAQCKHVILLLCLIRSFKPTEVSVATDLPEPQQKCGNQEREYEKKKKFFSALLAIADHLKIRYTWPDPVNNAQLISSIIIGSLEFEKNMETTIARFLSS